jgi:uncharacterized protein YndB with AHSA1/START domain
MNASARSNNAPERPIEAEVRVARVFDAPRDLVFRTWIEPQHFVRWWGPRGFTNPVCELDAIVGGAILIHMRSPDGIVYPMTGTFREIAAPERLVFSVLVADRDGDPLLEGLVTATFEDVSGKTRLSVHEKAVGLAPIAVQILANMETGWAQSLERLDAVVA